MLRIIRLMLLWSLCTCWAGTVQAQGENNRWHFGKKQSINFNQNPPVQEESNMMTAEAAVSVSDASGNLLFYTMGSRIWNRNGVEMPNSTGLLGNGPIYNGQPQGSSAYGTQVIRHPGDANRYFVFSGDAQEDNSFNVYYSVVDMTLDGGLGAVVPNMKNIPIMSNGSEYMAVTRGPDCNSYWLIVRSNNIQVRDYYAFKIDINGVNGTPVITTPPSVAIGATLPVVFGNDGTTMYSIGQGMVFSRFNNQTGVVYDFQSFTLPMVGPIAVSPDNTKLYISLGNMGLNQYDLSLWPNLAAIQNSAQVVSPPPAAGNMAIYHDMRCGPDGKLYLIHQEYSANYLNLTLDCIEQPNLSGTAAGYTAAVFDYNSLWSPPPPNLYWRLGTDFVVNPPADTVFNATVDTLICFGAAVQLQAYDQFAAAYQWNTGDTGSTLSVTEDGTYWVYSSDDCRTLIDSFHVQFVRFDLELPEDTAICPGTALTIDIRDNAIDTYVWSDGDQSGLRELNAEGTYIVTAAHGPCALSDTLRLSVLQPEVTILGNDTSMCNTNLVALHATSNIPGSFSWNTGTTGAWVTPDHSGWYTVTTTNECGDYKDSVWVNVEDCICELKVPNAFTPNGDGRNDVFLPATAPGCNFMFYEMIVYNRYGQAVFYSGNAQVGWDGYYQNEPAISGVYMYMIKYTNRYTGTVKIEKGDVMLMR